MKILEGLGILFEKKENYKLRFLLFGSLLIPIFELIGIGSIPAFAIVIIDIDKFLNILSNYINVDYIRTLEYSTVTIFAAAILALVFLIKNFYLFLILYFQGLVLKDLIRSISLKLFKYYINLPYIEHISKNPAILIRTIESDVSLSFNYITSSITIIRELVVLISIFILLLITDPYVSTFSLLFLGIPLGLFYLSYRKILKKRGIELQELLGKKFKIINQSLGLIKETKILKRESFFFDKFSKINNEVENINFFSYLITSTPRLFLEVIALISVAVVCVVLIFLGRSPDTIIPTISLFAISVIRFIPGLNAITASLTTLRFRKPSFDLIVREIKNLKKYGEIKKPEQNQKRENIEFKNEIKLENISFNYKSNNRKVLKNINVNIKKGSSVGIIGRSGSGKSTLVDIILGLLDPVEGKISIDNNEITEVKNLWQKKIGYIPQDIYLLDDTIKNNIIFGVSEDKISNQLLWKSIKIAQLENFVEFSYDKIETEVGERGIKISGGEKQRIGIARAMYNQPEILIFDEATSALDIDNENKILDETYQGMKDKTKIIISHRNNTVKFCDLIYVMEEGEIIDSGPYEKIINKYGYLKEENKNEQIK